MPRRLQIDSYSSTTSRRTSRTMNSRPAVPTAAPETYENCASSIRNGEPFRTCHLIELVEILLPVRNRVEADDRYARGGIRDHQSGPARTTARPVERAAHRADDRVHVSNVRVRQSGHDHARRKRLDRRGRHHRTRRPRSPSPPQTPTALRSPPHAAAPASSTCSFATSLDERHLVNLSQRRRPVHDLFDRRLTQEAHALLARRLLYFGRRPPLQNHLPDAVRQVQQLTDRRPSLVSGARALDAASAFVKRLCLVRARGRAPTPPAAHA